MLRVALRARWTTFTGTFLALALGVGVIATMCLALAATFDAPRRGTERFAAAPVVVRGADEARVGERTVPLERAAAVPDEVLRQLAGTGRVVPDRTFPVRMDGLPRGTVGHPWAAHAFTPYHLLRGRAPAVAGEVVVEAGAGVRVGERVRLVTPAGVGGRTVVGVVADRPFESAVFLPDAEAARIAPRVEAVAVYGAPAGAVRAAVRDAPGLRVLTGDARRAADPDPDRDARALVTVNALLGTAAGVTGFVSVFVVASTFAFSVARRRREFALLRLAGATPGQVRAVVLGQAAVVGAAASAAGCALGAAGAPVLASWLVERGAAPEWFAVGDQRWPLHVAFWTGLLVALAGVVAATARAGRVAPAEALRQAAADDRFRPLGRLLCGAALAAGTVGVMAVGLVTDPGDLLHRKTYTTRPMLLAGACALLAPALAGPLVAALARPLSRLPGVTGRLAAAGASAGARRTAAAAAPVLLTVALTGCLLGAAATAGEARAAQARARTAADFVVAADGAALPADLVRRVRAVAGARTAAFAEGRVYAREGPAVIRSRAHAAEPAELRALARPPLVAGSLADLDDGGIVVNEEWTRRTVGERVPVRLGDGRAARLRIVAVMRAGTGDNGVYVTPRNAGGAEVTRVEVRVREGAGREAVAAGLREAARPYGATVATASRWVAATHPRTGEQTRLGVFLVLGIALLYTALSLVNTQAMAVADRTRELAALRLAGATAGQAVRVAAAEALLVAVVGAVLGAGVVAVQLLGLQLALAVLSVDSAVVVPWPELGGVTGGCAALSVAAAVAAAWVALRRGRRRGAVPAV
ncbi:ABC transporter permease [Streptomyces capparidis]